MTFLIVVVIAVSLSMDAFSLSLAYGTLNIPKKQIIQLSLIVGIYHFFMPLLGMNVGNIIINILPIKTDTIVFLVLSIIGLQMILESLKNGRKLNIMNILELLFFGLAVSLDSFSVGIGLKSIYHEPLICSLIFALSSFVFTYLGLILGKKINELVGTISTIIGGIILIVLGIFYLI